MTVREVLRAPGRAGWTVLAVLAFLNHNLYICGAAVDWVPWFTSLGLSMLVVSSSGVVFTAFALKRSRRREDTGS